MTLTVLLLVAVLGSHAHGALKLANSYASHMVLQRGPQQAVLWGTASTEGVTVTAHVRGPGAPATASSTTTVTQGTWKLLLPAITDPGPFQIDVTSQDGNQTLQDVLFGDVWVCSGQSNMEFTMAQVMNSSAEVQKGLSFNTIRYMMTSHVQSTTLLDDVKVRQAWTAPTQATLPRMSAVCFLFAEYLQPHLNYPIGLVGTYWGGTSIEAWSPPEVKTACPSRPLGHVSCCPHEYHVLWNAMMAPLLPMTIAGSLWYQGETNSGHYPEYSCQIQEMVKQWRSYFHQQSMGQTALDFPFGYVQLADLGDSNNVGSFPFLRWAQTANHGYSPNPDMPRTFMAVAMDLPDVHSPYGAIHPRYKQEVAERLVSGARHVAYGQNVAFQGPFPSSFISDPVAHSLTVQYQPDTVTSLDIRSTDGFEVCCTTQTCNERLQWTKAPITAHSANHVTLDVSGCAPSVLKVRYAWHQTPCPLLQCAVYDAGSGLPAPTFLHTLGNDIIG